MMNIQPPAILAAIALVVLLGAAALISNHDFVFEVGWEGLSFAVYHP